MKKRGLALLLTWCLLATMLLGIIPAAASSNLAEDATATASSYENNDPQFSPEKAIDGDRGTRWATNRNQAVGEWINVQLAAEAPVQQVNIVFERTDANQNILGFKVEIRSSGVYTDVHQKNEKAKQVEIVTLDAPVENATDVRVTILAADGGTSNWVNVGISEIEIYSSVRYTLDQVIAMIEGVTVDADADTFPMPQVPDGFTIGINGADFEQIIANDGRVMHPLIDKTVKVSFKVTETESGNTRMTGDYEFLVKGRHTPDSGKNTKPVVIPEIAEWYSDSTGRLESDRLSAVTYDDAALETVVDEFIKDYEAFSGVLLQKQQGQAKAGAFNFSLQAPDALLGSEGYRMELLSDRVNVASESAIGNMYGMQTILQMYRTDSAGFPVGVMRDYPRFQTRGFALDVARRPFSLAMLEDFARTMRYYKMNDFHLHLSDNYIWLEQYGTYANEEEGFKAYDAFRLESGLTNADGQSPTAADYHYTKAEFRQFIQSQRAMGMNIVPEIDFPAHANSFTKVWPELRVVGKVLQGHPLIDHMDITKTEAVDKIKEVFDDYTKGADPVFDGHTTVHIGADEFVADYTAYRNFINTLVPHIKQTNPVRLWGSLTWLNDNTTAIVPEAIENVTINLWSADWADGKQMYDMGFKLINTIGTFNYLVPNGDYGRGNQPRDMINKTNVFNNFEPNRVAVLGGGWYTLPSGDPQVLGAAFALWNDSIDKRASGLTESDIYWRFFDALPVYAEKNWAATGREKGTIDVLTDLAEKMGTGPNTNPYYQVHSTGEAHVIYRFDGVAPLSDSSGNGRELQIPNDSTARTDADSLLLENGRSYAETPLDKIGNGNELSFDITLTAAAQPGDILFETDAPYGTHDIRVMEDGKLGFTRELYNYYFDYQLPVGQKVNLRFVVRQQSTKLYVDGRHISDAVGKFIHNGMEKKTGIAHATFALPIGRIGSQTRAIAAVIDNVNVRNISNPSLIITDHGKNGLDVDIGSLETADMVTDGDNRALDGYFQVPEQDREGNDKTGYFNNVTGGNKSFTLETEVRPNDKHEGHSDFSVIGGRGDNSVILRVNAAQFNFFIKNTNNQWKSIFSGEPKITDSSKSSWFKVAAVYNGENGGTLTLYVDGVERARMENVGQVKATDVGFWIGRDPETGRGSTNHFRSFHVYSKALTAAEIGKSDADKLRELYDNIELWYDFTFTAQPPAVYTLNYELNGGAWVPDYDPPREHIHGTATPLPAADRLQRNGYRFVGWYNNENFTGNPLTELPAEGVTADVTLYARWETVPYRVTYTLNGGTVPQPDTNPEAYTVESESFTLKNPERTGHTFKGWSGTGLTGENNQTVTVPRGSTGDRSYAAHWMADSYRITYILNDGANPASAPESYTYGKGATLPIPVRANFTFEGWYTNAGFTGDPVTAIGPAEMGEKTFYARWEAKPVTYIVVYTDGVADEEVFADDIHPDLLAGDATPAYRGGTPTRAGYVFAGWRPAVAEKVTNSVRYTAMWKADRNGNGVPDDEEPHYTVTYTDGVADEEVFADDIHPDLLAGDATPAYRGGTPTRAGYVFAGWKPAVAEKVSGNAVYAAQWEEKLPDTGALWWPVPMLALLGAALVGGGIWRRRKRSR